MGWLTDFRADVARYSSAELPLVGRDHSHPSRLLLVLSHRELWAVLHYRLAHALLRSSLPAPVKRWLLLISAFVHRFVEVVTGICLPAAVEIGPGLKVAHPGSVVVNAAAVIGKDCLICHGVTLGSQAGERSGAPVVGDHVYIGTNAVVAGGITVGDHAVISANSLVIRDVPAGALARGVPAEVFVRGPAVS
jgi:serine O-acetyltransferase